VAAAIRYKEMVFWHVFAATKEVKKS